MSTSTASPELRVETRNRRHREGRWFRLAGPVAVLALAGLAVGRFVTAGSSGVADGPAVTAPVAPAGSVEALRNEGIAAVREAIRTGDPGYYGKATEALDEALRLAPDDGLTLGARAVLALSVHDFAGALPLAQRAVAANAFSTTALAALVDARVENGDYAGAESALGQLLDADPGVAAYARVSYLRQLGGDREGAETAMRQAVAAASGSDRAVVLTYLGDIQLERGEIDDAAMSYSAASREQPGFVGAELGSARARIANGDLPGAALALDALVARSPQPAVAGLRGELALMMNDGDAAAGAFALVEANEQILRSQGVVTDLESALFLSDHGDPAAALVAAKAAYAARHTVFTADAMAWAMFKAGDAAGAVRYVEQALAGGLDAPGVRVHAAAVFASVGDVARAADELRTAFIALPWLTPSIRGAAFDLAGQLGVEVPKGWLP